MTIWLGVLSGVGPQNFPLVVHIHQSFSFHLWCMLWGSLWFWMNSNLFWFNEGQTYGCTSWHAKMSLTLMVQYRICLVQTSMLPESLHQKFLNHGSCIQNHQLQTKNPVELKDCVLNVYCLNHYYACSHNFLFCSCSKPLLARNPWWSTNDSRSTIISSRYPRWTANDSRNWSTGSHISCHWYVWKIRIANVIFLCL